MRKKSEVEEEPSDHEEKVVEKRFYLSQRDRVYENLTRARAIIHVTWDSTCSEVEIDKNQLGWTLGIVEDMLREALCAVEFLTDKKEAVHEKERRTA